MIRILSNAFLSIVPLFLCILQGSAQVAPDTVYMRDGSMLEVQVKSTDGKAIQYSSPDNTGGPVYSIEKPRILKIAYANGSIQTFEKKPGDPAPKSRRGRPAIDYGRHFAGINFSDLFRTDVTLQYEYLLKNNRIGFRIPLSIGFNNNYFNINSKFENPYVFRRNRIFSIGLDARFYPGGQGKARYVAGPGVYYILNNKRGPLTAQGPVNNHPVNTIRLMVYNGVVFTPTPHFRFGMDLGLGTQYDLRHTQYTDERVFGDPKIQFNFYGGYKF